MPRGLIRLRVGPAIPLRVYLKDGRFKMELGLCKGKKLHDKREDMAQRDTKREIQRALRTNNRGE